MTPGEILTDRIRQALAHLSSVKEQRMIGGLAFMVNGKLCVGVYSGGEMMVRCDPQMTDELLTKKGTRRGEMRGKLMTKGWLLINPEGIAGENDFDYWIGEIQPLGNFTCRPIQNLAQEQNGSLCWR